MNLRIKSKPIASTALMGLILLSACATVNKDIKPEQQAPAGKEPKMPSLKSAELKAIWVPDKIDGNQWEAGHYLYVIEKPSTWRVDK